MRARNATKNYFIFVFTLEEQCENVPKMLRFREQKKVSTKEKFYTHTRNARLHIGNEFCVSSRKRTQLKMNVSETNSSVPNVSVCGCACMELCAELQTK